MNVSVVIPTRGDVDLQPVLDSFPPEWETVIWDNSGKIFIGGKRLWGVTAGDLAVYGRYAAIAYAKNDIILTQDDDVIVSNPQAIVDEWLRLESLPEDHPGHPHSCHVVCNMPAEFRHAFNTEHALVGFGAAFHRDAPGRAFAKFTGMDGKRAWPLLVDPGEWNRTCDVVFTGLTPRVLVDVPKTDLAYASASNRMWKQPEHQGERQRMLDLVRKVK